MVHKKPTLLRGSVISRYLLCDQLAQQRFGFGEHIFHSEAKLFEACSTRSRCAKAIHGHAVAIETDEAMPAEGFSRFNHDAFAHGFGEDLSLLVIGLLMEQLDCMMQAKIRDKNLKGMEKF